MPHPNNRSLPEKVMPWLTLLASFGISAGGAGAIVATFWQSAAGELAVSKRLLLVLSAATASLVALGVWWIWKKRKYLLSLKRPHYFQDDYLFDSRLGLYRHKSKLWFYCPKCVLKGIQSPLPDSIKFWQCLADDSHFFENPDYVPF